MKTTLRIAIIMMAAITAHAQNSDAPYDISHFNGQTAHRGGTININWNDTTRFAPLSETNRFMFGWQWTVKLPSIINKRLHTNLARAGVYFRSPATQCGFY
ncbi:MAG: hypothetical protein JNL32_12350 [Candidatus Kapabacteria bacterium]|nr:hypothetical protein [Candidatus Kapabacteria bacterium]